MLGYNAAVTWLAIILDGGVCNVEWRRPLVTQFSSRVAECSTEIVRPKIMGCASSGQVANTGKNFIDTAKETANDVAAKGEKTIQGEWRGKILNSRIDYSFLIYFFFVFD